MYPAGEAGITVRYVSVGSGIRVRVLDSGPSSGSPVVLVHGWGSSVYSFSAIIPALARAGHRTIAFDLPGHGLSDKPVDPRLYSTDALVDVLRDLIRALGLRRVAVVAHSMGGPIALRLAARDDGTVEKLALVSAVGLGAVPIIFPLKLFLPRVIDRVVPTLLTRKMLTTILRVAYATPGRPTPRDIDEYWAPTQFDEYARVCRILVRAFTWRRAPATLLRRLRMPVLVVAARKDLMVHGVASRGRLIPSARVVSIPDGGHLVVQECSDRVNEELLPFLASSGDRVASNAYHH